MNEPPPSRPGLFSRFREGLRGSAGTEKPARIFRFPLHAYGKLPVYKDFIATGLTEPGAREFRSWLDRGFSRRWSADEEYRSTIIPSHSFLFRLPESKTCVAGTLWGSSDEGGLRKFPFAVFVSFPPGHAAAEPLAALMYLPALESRAREIRDGFGSAGSLTTFYAKYRGAEVDCPVKPRERLLLEAKEELGAFRLSELGESVMGPEAQGLWPGFVTELERAAVQGLEGGAGVLRLPIGDGITPARQLKFWMLWLERTSPKRRNTVLGLLYANVSGRAALFFRDLHSEDILLLHPTKDCPGALDPLAAVRRAARASGEPEAAAAPSLPVAPYSAEPEAPAPALVFPTSGTEASAPALVLSTSGTEAPTSEPVLSTSGTEAPAPAPALVLSTSGTEASAPALVLAPSGTEAPAPAPVLATSGTEAPASEPVLSTSETEASASEPVLSTSGTEAPAPEPVLSTPETEAPTSEPVLSTSGTEAPASEAVLSTSGTEAADPEVELENAGTSPPTSLDAPPPAAPPSEASLSEVPSSAPALPPGAPESPPPSLAGESGSISTESTERPAGSASDPQDLPGTGSG